MSDLPKPEHSCVFSKNNFEKGLDRTRDLLYNDTNFTETGTKRVVSVFAVIQESRRQWKCGMTDSLNGLFRAFRNAQVSMEGRECGPVINPRRMMVRAKWIERSM
jgi:hypothetical protein